MSREEYRIDRQYLLDLLTALAELRRELEKSTKAKALWESRRQTALENGRPGLADAAAERLGEATERLVTLKVEERRLLAEAENARRAVRAGKAGALVETDAGRLLAELRALAGEPDELRRAADELEAEKELQRLRDALSDGDEA